MKKLIWIAPVLALVVTLCFSPSALAWDFELQEDDGATAEWTDETAAVGDYSVKLDWPAPYRDADNNYIVPRASVAITDSPDLAIGVVDSWSYWIKAPSSYAPNLTFSTDTLGDESSDTTITAWPTNAPGDEWSLIDETTIGGYKGAYIVWGSNPWPSYKFDWSAVQVSYGDAEILDLLIGKGVIGTNQDITVFVDDFTLNGITYSFEPPPPPPTPPAPTTGGGGLMLIPAVPYLVIQLPAERIIEKPDHDKIFFGSAGWGNPTTEDIVFSDGTWQVELEEGTAILLDGEWHKHTILELDSQGQLIGKYGYDGHITAEETLFSKSPTITKL